MENKDVERCIDRLVRQYKKSPSLSLGVTCCGFRVTKYIKELEKEIKRLRQVVKNQNVMINKLKEKETKRWY